VTWWQRIPAHRHATPAELGSVLRQVHALPVPQAPELAALNPFDGLDDHTTLTAGDRAWLRERLATLRSGYTALLPGLGVGVVHGDAWQGNVIVPHDGGDPVLVDLDHVGVGPREWDLVPIAVDHTDFARISTAQYREFVDALDGVDVTRSPAFDVLAAITETRWTAFTIRSARHDDRLVEQVRHRLRCLQGAVPKPWTWSAT